MEEPVSFEVVADQPSDTILVVLVERNARSLLATLSPEETVRLVGSLTVALAQLGTQSGMAGVSKLLPLLGAAIPDPDGQHVLLEVKLNNSLCVAQMRLTKQVALGIADALRQAAQSQVH